MPITKLIQNLSQPKISASTLISCIMPTNVARRDFILFAIHHFQKQSYPNTELIVLDDAAGAIEHLIPVVDNIRYHKTNRKLSTGAKRNLACEQAHGEYILNWDDDDWYAPDWITQQVYVLQQSGADICGLKDFYFYRPSEYAAWKYRYYNSKRDWVAGATMAYKRSHWQRYPYKDMQVGEDNDFAWNSKGKVFAHSYIDGFVSILHSNNTSPKNTKSWQKQDVAIIEQILKDDMHFYKSMQAG
jgi:glycosyltransferase involved in cell wall biosynthesis